MIKITLLCLIPLFINACGDDNAADTTADTTGDTSGNTQTGIDITDDIFTSKAASCAAYSADYYSTVIDAQSSQAFSGDLSVTLDGTDCLIQTNAIPNHDFNVNGSFTTAVSAQNNTYRVTSVPSFAASTTPLEMGESAVFLNGVKLDILPAACFDVGSEPIGTEKIACGPDQLTHPWRYDPMSVLNNFGTDDNNAHTQPNGTYHYHGNPLAMFDVQCDSNMTDSPVIGFAADGYPIFGSCFDDNGTIRKATSGYSLKNSGTARQLVVGYSTPSAGVGNIASSNYDGQFRGDWEFTGAGDLDECNGMTVNGQYAYYVTDTFPWVMNCLKGSKHSNFTQ